MKLINKLMLLCGFFCLLSSATIAQPQLTWTWPQYALKGSPHDRDSVIAGCVWFGRAPFVRDSLEIMRTQSAYMPYMFPGAPEGRVVSIYFRVSTTGAQTSTNNPHVSPTIYDSVTVKMGYLEDSLLAIQSSLDEQVAFRKNLTTVFQASTITLYDLDSFGSRGCWTKLTLNAGSFYFRHNQNFVLELAGHPRRDHDEFDIASRVFPVIDFNTAGRRYYLRSLFGPSTSDSTKSIISDGVIAIGFDITPVGVSPLSNIRGIGLFPNPATNGRFNISLDAKQPMKEVSIAITDITGREVLSRKYAHPGSSFFEEINLAGAARGMYFVRIATDGEVISRRVSIQ